MVAQLNTFLLAAFESTAAAIAFSVYFISQHPTVEERLVQEVTAAAVAVHTQLDLAQVGGWDGPAIAWSGRSASAWVLERHVCRHQFALLAVCLQVLEQIITSCLPCCCLLLLQLPYTDAVVKEALRLLPPGAIATRSTEQQGLQLTPQVRDMCQSCLAGCSCKPFPPHSLTELLCCVAPAPMLTRTIPRCGCPLGRHCLPAFSACSGTQPTGRMHWSSSLSGGCR